jgi:N-acetylglutamate synthase
LTQAPSPLALEEATLATWRAREDESHFGWRFLAEAGFSGRVNAVWPLAWTGPVGVGPAIEAAEAWYAARSLPCVFKIADSCAFPYGLPEELAARGYAPDTETLVMHCGLARAGVPLDAPWGLLAEASGEDIVLTAHRPSVFETVLGLDASPGDAAERLAVLGRTPRPRAFGVIRRDHRPAAVGMMSLAPNGYAGVYAMRTLAPFRRQGLAMALLDALAAAAEHAKAHSLFLQVEAANGPAIALYRRAGFETAYAYRYWRKS